MSLTNKISCWYFKHSALPFGGVLMLDCAIVMIAGYLAAYLHFGGMQFAQHFWPVTYGMLATLVLFVACFKIFHTYVGIIRYSSFVDLRNVAIATATASFITMLMSFFIKDVDIIIIPTSRHCVTIFVVTTLLMWLVRVSVKGLYDSFRKNSETSVSSY